MKKRLFLIILTLAMVPAAMWAKSPKYIFYFIGDGMSINSVYGTELYKAAKNGTGGVCPLTFTSFPCRSFISTYAVGKLVTDSSASGTALACGHKTLSHYTGVDENKDTLRSIACDLKRKKGYGTGVVTTVGVNHATPSVFYAHSSNRYAYEDIYDQLLNGFIDFAAGAGVIPDKEDDSKCPGLVEKARKAGWSVTVGKEELKMATRSPRTMCLVFGNSSHMPYAMQDTPLHLADLTAAAVANMEKYHPKKFFLMIEGGRIDYAAHENDAKCLFEEILDMDKAVDVAMEFYRKHPDETLIIVTADHETGGLYLDNSHNDVYPELLLHQTVAKGDITSAISALRKRGGATWEEAKAIISEGTGLWSFVSVTEQEELHLKTVFEKTVIGGEHHEDKSLYANNEILAKESIDLLCRKAMFRFGSSRHTAAQVPLFAIGAGAAEVALSHDNSDIPNILRTVTGTSR